MRAGVIAALANLRRIDAGPIERAQAMRWDKAMRIGAGKVSTVGLSRLHFSAPKHQISSGPIVLSECSA